MSHLDSRCDICHKEFPLNSLVPAELVGETLTPFIKKQSPEWSEKSSICYPDLNHFRSQYVSDVLKEDDGEISAIENEVVKSLREHELLTQNLNSQFEEKQTFGEKVADKIAEFGGSWRFIITFGLIIAIWITINSLAIFKSTFDPYPFILLNLVLSCLAALQAPVIMMSQNRQESKDRMRAELDYKINLKAELEIRHLKTKLDQLSSHQWRRLLEIQKVQTELLAEMAKEKAK
ncbi:MAG: DUF1003 domain-containing protein [Bacteriovoracaceae bacterium]|nr:DUF1003 domain-containing protein [Bacteriovoracaceae bacterium]